MQKEISTITRSVIFEKQASLAVVDLTSVVAEARKRHSFSPFTAAAFARAAVCAAYLCGWAEEEQEVSLVINGGGELGKLCVYGNGRLSLCGFAENNVAGDLNGDKEQKIIRAVGAQGEVSVTLSGRRGLPFAGSCSMVRGDIASDMEEYFRTSEQRPTAISLYEEEANGKLVCGGVFIQPLTGAPAKIWDRAKELAARCTSQKKANELLRDHLNDNKEVREIKFGCTCSQEKAERALLAVGFEAAMACLKQENIIKVHCHRCNTDYAFGEKEIRTIFNQL